MDRLYAVLLGDDRGPDVAVRTAILSAAIGGAVVHPLVADLDDDTLRTELLAVTHHIFEVPD